MEPNPDCIYCIMQKTRDEACLHSNEALDYKLAGVRGKRALFEPKKFAAGVQQHNPIFASKLQSAHDGINHIGQKALKILQRELGMWNALKEDYLAKRRQYEKMEQDFMIIGGYSSDISELINLGEEIIGFEARLNQWKNEISEIHEDCKLINEANDLFCQLGSEPKKTL